ncbi:amidase signature domain-containing protein [Ilyonectria robusta]|uniref:amidase signature domain-containing protein n=1 Tax=Ilyonectria robusta TaxID=1079257 RepID=UPI001E8E64A1|nr:amidase signature domain-containing protein [Ilyonectria robusta]KAH8684074.1 amidase signature domain-containing protein [Ilyonectria robusta]
MSVVSSEVSPFNPITDSDVRNIAAKLGFHVEDAEVEPLRLLLTAAHDTFKELSKLEDYNPPLDRQRFSSSKHPTWLTDGTSWLPMNIVVKDNICVADIRQQNGTDALPSWVPESDATVVTRILECGGRIVGTATCEALSCATAKGYSAGGSSSGVAGLVGRRKFIEDKGERIDVDMGMGADQGGSIRVPAAFCGLVGLKATHGLIPYTGVISCEPVLDHVGPICKTVWDTALLLEAIAGRDGLDDRQSGAHDVGEVPYSTNLDTWYNEATKLHGSKQLSGLKVAILTETIDAPFVTAAMEDEVRAVAGQLEQLGASVEQISMPSHATARSLWMGQTLIPWTQSKWDKLPAGMRNEFINGAYEADKYPSLYQKCMNLTIKVTNEYEDIFRTFNVLLMPSVPFTAPPLFDRDTASSMKKISSTFGQTLNTMQFNLTSHPAMVIPTGRAPDMSGKYPETLLPLSVQFVGPLHGEQELLKFRYTYEKGFD